MQKFLFIIVLFLIGISNTSIASNQFIEIKGMRINHELTVPGTPEKIYDAITGDISGWWDHSFSENPLKFYIEAKPGGGFFEIFDESGDGVKHATVTFAQKGKLLRFEGPLGLTGRALHLVHTYEFTAQGSDSTRLKLTINGIGELDQDLVDLVDSVWHHFLFERFKPYVKGDFKPQKK